MCSPLLPPCLSPSPPHHLCFTLSSFHLFFHLLSVCHSFLPLSFHFITVFFSQSELWDETCGPARRCGDLTVCVCVCVSTSLPRLCICFFLSVVEDTFEKLAVLDAVPKTSVDLSPRLHTGLSDCLPLSLPLSPLPSDSPPPPFSPAVGSDCSHCGQK